MKSDPPAARSGNDLNHEVPAPIRHPSVTQVSLNAGQTAAPQQPTRVAVIATHGMGQQIPFQTLDDVTQGLINAAVGRGARLRLLPGASGRTPKTIIARTVQVGDEKLQRTEFGLHAEGRDVEVHVYEGYWAPLIEGELKIRELLRFLYSAAWNGILNSRTPFRRWMFGGMTDFGVQPRTTWNLLLTAGIVTALVVLNTIIGIVAAARLLNPNATSDAWPGIELLAALTLIVSVFCVFSILFAGSLGFARGVRKRIADPSRRGAWGGFTALLQGYAYLWYAITLATMIALVVVVIWDALQPNGLGPLPRSLRIAFSSPVIWWIVWGALVLVSMAARRLLVQYLGDVAIYVTSHKVDRFMDIRRKIKAWVRDVFRAVYAATDVAGQPLYDGIGVLGHSLGSVVSYDTLNSLMVDDDLSASPLGVADRTKVFVTFGSPLDKTAFIFGLQGKRTTETREALAASVQPLIQDYTRFRKLRWINVFSHRDPVSGSLDFYDDKQSYAQPVHRVENVEDRSALIPLVAHLEYWKNTLVFRQILEGLHVISNGVSGGTGAPSTIHPPTTEPLNV